LELEFMGHYGEPNLGLVHEVVDGDFGKEVLYSLEYNPENGEWKTARQSTSAQG
jgi:mono-ADP-ribosyltransferase sirtuin 6